MIILLQTLPFAPQSTSSGKQKSGVSPKPDSQAPKRKPRIVPSKDPGFAFEVEGLDGGDDQMDNVTKFGKQNSGTNVFTIYFNT